MKASAPGQLTRNPSPAQKVPNEVSMIPTTNFSVFSGTFVNGLESTITKDGLFEPFQAEKYENDPNNGA